MSQTKTHPYPSQETQVIHVKGSEREIGRQHAEQLGDCVGRGMAKFYYDFWKRLMTSQKKSGIRGAAFNAAKWLIDPLLVKRLSGQMTPLLKDRIQGMSDVSGLPYEQLVTAIVLPDLLPILQAYLVKFWPQMFVEAAAPPRFGCTSFVSAGERFLYGRNLDFPGVAYWDRYPVIQVTSRRNSLRYIGFTSAGVPIGGITGVNEAQISVALHQHYCRNTSLRGTLPFAIAEEILSQAHTLREAMEILDRGRVASSWAFIVADGKSREAFLYETHPQAHGVIRLTDHPGILAHSNFFQTSACSPAEYATTARMNWDNHSRKRRLEELILRAGKDLAPAVAVQALSDHFDPFWGEEKIINRTVSQVYNIQSILLDLESMKGWMAEGDAPIHLREYVEYDLGEIFQGRDGKTGIRYPAYHFQSESKRNAKEAYIGSFIAAFDNKFDVALEEVRCSLAHDYCAEAGFVACVLLLKKGNFTEGCAELLRAKEWMEAKLKERMDLTPPPEYFEIGLFLARAYDLLGKRGEAIRMYQSVATHPALEDKNLKTLATAARPYSVQMLSRILMPYSTYVPFQ